MMISEVVILLIGTGCGNIQAVVLSVLFDEQCFRELEPLVFILEEFQRDIHSPHLLRYLSEVHWAVCVLCCVATSLATNTVPGG